MGQFYFICTNCYENVATDDEDVKDKDTDQDEYVFMMRKFRAMFSNICKLNVT